MSWKKKTKMEVVKITPLARLYGKRREKKRSALGGLGMCLPVNKVLLTPTTPICLHAEGACFLAAPPGQRWEGVAKTTWPATPKPLTPGFCRKHLRPFAPSDPGKADCGTRRQKVPALPWSCILCDKLFVQIYYFMQMLVLPSWLMSF